MDIFVMIVAIVAITTAGKAISDLTRARRGSKERDNELNERVNHLEERVRTLEQIVTDKKSRLKEEIDSL